MRTNSSAFLAGALLSFSFSACSEGVVEEQSGIGFRANVLHAGELGIYVLPGSLSNGGDSVFVMTMSKIVKQSTNGQVEDFGDVCVSTDGSSASSCPETGSEDNYIYVNGVDKCFYIDPLVGYDYIVEINKTNQSARISSNNGVSFQSMNDVVNVVPVGGKIGGPDILLNNQSGNYSIVGNSPFSCDVSGMNHVVKRSTVVPVRWEARYMPGGNWQILGYGNSVSIQYPKASAGVEYIDLRAVVYQNGSSVRYSDTFVISGI